MENNSQMKIAIITPGVNNLPIPAVNGGAVENLITSFIEQNELVGNHFITVYSSWSKDAELSARAFKKTNFIFVRTDTIFYRISKFVRYIIRRFFKVRVCNAFVAKISIKNSDYDAVVIENRPDYGEYFQNIENLYLHLHNDIKIPKELICSFKKIITVSNFISEIVKKNHPAANVNTLYNGIDVKKFTDVKFSKFAESFRDKFEISENTFVILYTGRITPQKGVKELVEAYSRLKSNPKLVLVIAGSSVFGKTKIDDYRKSLISLAKTSSNRVVFTGYIPYEVLPEVYSLSNLIVIPSVWDDPSPLTVYESLATGKQVIVTNSGGIPEIVNKSNAKVVNRENNLIDNLASFMQQAIDSNKDNIDEQNILIASQYTNENYYNNFINLLTD